MVKTIKAPKGFHFMVDQKSKDYFIMKTKNGIYNYHKDGSYESSLFIEIDTKVKTKVKPTSAPAPKVKKVQPKKRITRTVTPTITPRSSGGGYSGGGGY